MLNYFLKDLIIRNFDMINKKNDLNTHLKLRSKAINYYLQESVVHEVIHRAKNHL